MAAKTGKLSLWSMSTISMVLAFVSLLVFPSPCEAQLNISTTPSTMIVQQGQTNVITVQYDISWIIGSFSTINLESPFGQFTSVTGGRTIFGSNYVPFIYGQAGSGSTTFQETLTISPSLIEQVLSSGSRTFQYKRVFNGIIGSLHSSIPEEGIQYASVFTLPDLPDFSDPSPNFSLTVSIPISIKTNSEFTGPLSLRRIDLYFVEDEIRRGELSVEKGTKGLKAYADLELSGSGFLEGNWVIDGQTIEQVRQYASAGRRITVSTSDTPGIPTFSPGLHTIRFELTNPVPPFEQPRIFYFIVQSTEKPVQEIILQYPEDNALIPPDTEFAWWPISQAVVYEATYRRESDNEVVLSALVKDGNYMASEEIYKDRFVSGVRYLWQIEGFDAEGRLISRSAARRFVIR